MFKELFGILTPVITLLCIIEEEALGLLAFQWLWTPFAMTFIGLHCQPGICTPMVVQRMVGRFELLGMERFPGAEDLSTGIPCRPLYQIVCYTLCPMLVHTVCARLVQAGVDSFDKNNLNPNPQR